MREIIELNRRILAELPANIDEDSLPSIDRETGIEFWPGASSELIECAQNVVRELNRFIPEDFLYTVDLGYEEPHFMLWFHDGALNASFRPLEIKEHLSIEGQLGAMDWDGQRGEEISRCQTFDAMKEYSTNVPSRLPSTKELQRTFREEMKEWTKEKRVDASKVHVFMWREEHGFRTESYESLDALSDVLADIMVVELYVITILADGKPLPVQRIDQIKEATLQMMKRHMPISFARATGRFSGIMGPVGLGQEDENDEP